MASSSSSGAAAAAADHPSRSSHSPRSVRPSRHPWSHVVRGAGAADVDGAPSSPTPLAAAIPPPELSDRPAADDAASSSAAANPPPTTDGQGHGSNNGIALAPAARGKKPAWKRPSNGAIEAGPVMGAASWPALSESAKASPKSSSSEAVKPLADASVSVPSAGPLVHEPSPKVNQNNSNPSSTTNHAAPARQRPMKRGGSSGGGGDNSSGQPANGGLAQQPSPIIADKQAVPELSPRERSARNSTWTGGSGPNHHQGGGGDHHRGYGSSHRRVNNGGSGSGGGGGGGSHHGNYGGRRDQDRGGHDGYHQRGIGGRESHMQQRGARPFFRPSQPVTPPFMPPVRPFASPVVYPDMPSPMIYVAPQPPPESFRPLPFIPHPAATPAMFFPAIEPQRATLLKQIDYYFSSENLVKDIYLRRNMDEQGWVPISLIAGFNRVRSLADNIPYILDTVRFSTIVEVQGEKIRRRHDWMNWVLPQNNIQFGTVSNQHSGAPESDNLADCFQTVGLGDSSNYIATRAPTHNELLSRSASGNLNRQSQGSGNLDGEWNGQVAGHSISDLSQNGRALFRSDTL